MQSRRRGGAQPAPRKLARKRQSNGCEERSGGDDDLTAGIPVVWTLRPADALSRVQLPADNPAKNAATTPSRLGISCPSARANVFVQIDWYARPALPESMRRL